MMLTRKPTAPLRFPNPDVHAYPPSRDGEQHIRTVHSAAACQNISSPLTPEI